MTVKTVVDDQFSPAGYPLPAGVPPEKPFDLTYRNGHYTGSISYPDTCPHVTSGGAPNEWVTWDLTYRKAPTGGAPELVGFFGDAYTASPKDEAASCHSWTEADQVVIVPSNPAPKPTAGLKAEGEFSLSYTMIDADPVTLKAAPVGTENLRDAGDLNQWTFSSVCTMGPACALGASRPSGAVDQGPVTYAFTPAHDQWVSEPVHHPAPCYTNGTDKVLAVDGYDSTDQISVRPLIATKGSVQVLVGRFTTTQTPTAQGLAASAADCTPDHLDRYVILVRHDVFTSSGAVSGAGD
jgi:hypothetical protein